MREYYVYILASKSHRLYIGITNDLQRRMYEHLTATAGFTFRYRMRRLVHVETFDHPMNAIQREKQLKGWIRSKKVALIESGNPTWKDLAAGWFERTA
jgi:putative endonuclease